MIESRDIKHMACVERIKQLEEENKNLKDDIKKWEDRWMVKLAEIYVMPTRELTTAIAKNEWFSSWYDTVKNNMLHELWFDRLDVQDLLKVNKNLKEERDLYKARNEELNEDCFWLANENKNLKLIQETNEKQLKNDIKERDELREENKKLNIKVASLEWEIKWLNYTIDKLKEENQTLELWLDNKEKLNEEYRKLISKIDQLEEENENLRKDLFHLTNQKNNGKAK